MMSQEWMVRRGFYGLIVLVTFVLAERYISTHFANGGYLYDAGWFAGLIWKNDFWLRLPESIGSGSYYSTHFSPFLSLLALFSWGYWGTMTGYFALITGLVHAGLAALACLILDQNLKPGTWLGYLGVACAAWLLAFNGIAVSSLHYPHIELFIPLWGISFLVLLHKRRWLWATLAFLLTLSVREDAGFHLVAILGTIGVLQWRNTDPLLPATPLVVYLLAACLYSVLALYLQKHHFPTEDVFSRIYTGTPAYAHLTGEFFLRRLNQLLRGRIDLWLPLVIMAGSSLYCRNRLLLAGAVAYLPWLLLQITALSDAPGTLSLYYPFPLLIGFMGWLVILGYWPASCHGTHRAFRTVAVLLMVAAGFAPSWQDATLLVSGRWSAEVDRRISVVEQFTEALERGALPVQTMIVDQAVAALSPRSFTKNQIIPDHQPERDAGMTVFFLGWQDQHTLTELARAGQPYWYKLAGANLYIAARKPLTDLGGLKLESARELLCTLTGILLRNSAKPAAVCLEHWAAAAHQATRLAFYRFDRRLTVTFPEQDIQQVRVQLDGAHGYRLQVQYLGEPQSSAWLPHPEGGAGTILEQQVALDHPVRGDAILIERVEGLGVGVIGDLSLM